MWRCNVAGGGRAVPALSSRVQPTDPPSERWQVPLGERDGVGLGVHFTVYRGSSYVATLEIDGVTMDHAVGHVIPRSQKCEILAGDECATIL